MFKEIILLLSVLTCVVLFSFGCDDKTSQSSKATDSAEAANLASETTPVSASDDATETGD